MGKCVKCGSERIIFISGKTSDCFSLTYKDIDYGGYVPDNINIGGGDYIEFGYCADCGQIKGLFPITEEMIRKETTEENEEE